jgi:GNAT superfamily N-acetyltransferase
MITIAKTDCPTHDALLPFFETCFRAEYAQLLDDDTERMIANLRELQIDELLPGDGQAMFEARDQFGGLVGTVVMSEVGGSVYVWGLYVLPQAQHLGFGRQLMRAVCETCALGAVVEVQVLRASVRAQAFYRGLGFICDHTAVEEVFPGISLEVDFMRCERERCLEAPSVATRQLPQHVEGA